MMKYRIGLVIDKSTLTGGSNEEFVNFIFENSKNINRKKVKKAHTSNVILSRIGYGKYNYTTVEWKPTSNNVYSFDMECYDIDNMYQLLFEGISAIGNEELKFSNVSVDTSKVDYDRGIGTQTIKFDLNGKTYTFEADYYNDWYDIQILDFLNEILKNENSPKQLYFMGDGYQDFIVFYCDKEWANTFGEKTDCKLTTKAE